MENNHILTTIICILFILIALCVLFLMLKHLMANHQTSSSSSGHTHDKHCNDCCEAQTNGHCGKISLGKSKINGSGGLQPGINVQLIATGFFDWMIVPFLNPTTGLPGPNPINPGFWDMGDMKHYISPIVTIQNQSTNPMSVGLYHLTHSNPAGAGAFREAFKIPPQASTTVSYWKLMELWSNLGGSGLSPFPVQLAVAGEEAKGCYVISWCCPVNDSSFIGAGIKERPPFNDEVAVDLEVK